MPDKDIELRSEEVQEILSHIPHWTIRWGNFIILLILVIIGVLSIIIKYPDTVSGSVVLTTALPPQRVIAKTTGRIENILVKNGDKVHKGSLLAVIENTGNYVDILKLKEAVSGVKFEDELYTFPFEEFRNSRLGEVENALALFEKDYLVYKFNHDLQPHKVEKTSQSYQLAELMERLSLLEEQKIITTSELDLKKKELERFRKLYDKGVIATQEWETKNVQYLQTERSLKNVFTQISQIRAEIDDLRKNNKSTSINETKDNIGLLRNSLQSFNHLKESIENWELKYVLRSAIDGEVSFLQIWVENQAVTAGDEVFTVISSSKNYIAKVKVNAENSGKIGIGQRVNIKLSNYPDYEFGMLEGKIRYISLAPDEEGYILVDVILTNGLITTYGKHIDFHQEMVGSANIITADLRLIERLFYQFRDIFSRG